MTVLKRFTFCAAVMCLLLLSTACGQRGGGGTQGTGTGTPGTGTRLTGQIATAQELQLAQDLFNALNVWRAQSPRNLPALTYNASVAGVAYDHCADLDMRDYYLTVSPNPHYTPEGMDPGDRMTAASVTWSGYAENLAMGQATVSAVMAAWEASAGHNANMQTNLTQVGMGVRIRQHPSHTGSVQIIWCQLFRNP
ncbi:CAP domain-containing protein [Planctomycetota bacterium]|nr:CAP domain-containing protein [Planctomycetota bacterium]